MGGDYDRICYAVKNMIANLTGMICDGAKPSCALKIASGVSTALLSAVLAMEGRHVTSAEGIIDDDVDRSIRNLTVIGADAMCATDSRHHDRQIVIISIDFSCIHQKIKRQKPLCSLSLPPYNSWNS